MMRPLGKIHLGLLVLALVNMAPAVEADASWMILVIAALCAGFSCLLAGPSGGTRLPSWVIVLGVLGATANLLYEMFWPHTEATVYILDLAHFIIFLGCCKFFELRAARDVSLVLLISFLLLIISAFASGSLIFGLVLLFDVMFGTAWFMAFQADRDQAAVLQRRAAAFHEMGLEEQPSAVRPVILSYWKPALACALILLFVSVASFVGVPRGWGRGLFARIHRVMPASVPGFSPEVGLRDALVGSDASLVMRARFLRNGQPITDSELRPYLRGATFDRYQGGKWRKATSGGARSITQLFSGSAVRLNNLLDIVRGNQVVVQQIWVESAVNGALFSMYPPITFFSPDLRRLQLNRADLVLETDDQPRGILSYQVATTIRTAPTVNATLDPPIRRRRWVDSPSSFHPAVVAFVRERFQSSGAPREPKEHLKIATAICDFLRSDEFHYSQNRGRLPPGADPVKDFIFDNPTGHCEYFASAMTVMCQLLGIPTRLVNGYAGGEYNGVGGFFQFRQNHAHAWVEVWLADRGWTTFDPSPPRMVNDGEQARGFFAASRSLLDFVRFQWSALVVTFDASSRQDLLGWVENWIAGLEEGMKAPLSLAALVKAILWGPDASPLWLRICYWLVLSLSVALAVLTLRVFYILSLLAREHMSARDRRGKRGPREPDARFYDRLVLLLASKGMVRPAHVTPREFADQLAQTHADLKELPTFTDWFYEAQFGHRPLHPDQWQRINEALRLLREDPSFGLR